MEYDADVIIVGAGLGGLFTAAFLARDGYSVLLLEKNATPGGGLQSFKRGKVSFDTGMHIMGGWSRGGNLDVITRYLGIRNSLKLQDTDAECMDSVVSLSDNAVYKIASGRQGFIDSLAKYFPNQRNNLVKYVDAMERIADSFDLFNLRRYTYTVNFDADSEALTPVDKFVDKYITDSKLVAVLSYISGLYDGRAGRTPAYVHALISILYMNGSTRFVGGSNQLVDALINVIEDAGGAVLCNNEVNYIAVDDNKTVEYITTKSGNRKYRAREKYIWAAYPAGLINITTPGAFKKAFNKRVLSMTPTCSAFCVYIDLIPGTFQYINHTCYVHDDLETSWNFSTLDSNGIPRGFMYMTPPESDCGKYAKTLLIAALMNYDVVKQWSDSLTGHRAEEYVKWKESVADGLINKLAQVHPEINNCIRHRYTASPLTVRDFYNATDGAIYGYSKDCTSILDSQLTVVTKINNLLLTGQCINLHGICGVPLTALTTADVLLYPTSIIDKLNHTQAEE